MNERVPNDSPGTTGATPSLGATPLEPAAGSAMPESRDGVEPANMDRIVSTLDTASERDAAVELDLATLGLRTVNGRLNRPADALDTGHVIVRHPAGMHAIACGLQTPIAVDIDGHVGFYCAGMNQLARVTIHGHAGVGVAENMLSGRVHVHGNASQSAGATAHGGLLIVDGDCGPRCGISMKGVDIVVGGSVGHLSAFMAQSGRLVVLGDAGEALGDSIYEARVYVRGSVAGLGADCIEKPMNEGHRDALGALLHDAGVDADPRDFRRYGSARQLYHFDIDRADAY